MNTTFELNNIRKDADFLSGDCRLTKNSPVVEIFSAMVKGEELSRFGKKADEAVKYIENLGSRAENGDASAIAELNTIRRYVMAPEIMKEMKLFSVFGSYQHVGYDETIEREIWNHVGERSREQAASGDVVFPMIEKESYTVPTFTVSGGYQVDYRRVALGDMTREHEGMEQVRIDMRNRAMRAIIKKVVDAIRNASGVKYMVEAAGLTKTAVDRVLTDIRRWGRPTVVGDYALLAQFTPWAGYVGNIASNTITGVSEKVMNEIQQTGLLGMYNGTVLQEMPNPYDVTMPIREDAEGNKNFSTLMDPGLGLVLPTGVNSPIAVYSRGDITSLTGSDIKTGKQICRFDLEMGVDCARGHEYKIGLICDTNLSQN